MNPNRHIVPHENDILLGRGGNNNKHIGNEKLRNLAREQVDKYRISTKKEKSMISRTIVSKVKDFQPKGRFLKRCLKSGYWIEVEDDVAREKASQALRDAVSAFVHSSYPLPSFTSSGEEEDERGEERKTKLINFWSDDVDHEDLSPDSYGSNGSKKRRAPYMPPNPKSNSQSSSLSRRCTFQPDSSRYNSNNHSQRNSNTTSTYHNQYHYHPQDRRLYPVQRPEPLPLAIVSPDCIRREASKGVPTQHEDTSFKSASYHGENLDKATSSSYSGYNMSHSFQQGQGRNLLDERRHPHHGFYDMTQHPYGGNHRPPNPYNQHHNHPHGAHDVHPDYFRNVRSTAENEQAYESRELYTNHGAYTPNQNYEGNSNANPHTYEKPRSNLSTKANYFPHDCNNHSGMPNDCDEDHTSIAFEQAFESIDMNLEDYYQDDFFTKIFDKDSHVEQGKIYASTEGKASAIKQPKHDTTARSLTFDDVKPTAVKSSTQSFDKSRSFPRDGKRNGEKEGSRSEALEQDNIMIGPQISSSGSNESMDHSLPQTSFHQTF